MISYKSSPDIEYNGTENCARMQLFADTSTELTGVTHFDGILLLQGSSAYVISTGEKWMLDGSGSWILQPSDNAWQNIYTKAEIDTMINAIYQTMMYYHTAQESSDGTITFYTLGGNVGSLTIYGNGEQNGTPSPDNIIIPDFCGNLVGTDWTIPIACAGQTTTVYLGQVSTVRKIGKLVLDGTEEWERQSGQTIDYFRIANMSASPSKVICTHYQSPDENIAYATTAIGIKMQQSSSYNVILACRPSLETTSLTNFKSYLAAQYAAGHPVTIWYVLATEQTATVNEPLCKIGDYADVLHLTAADVIIPTVSGENTLTVDTDLPPSKIIISGE